MSQPRLAKVLKMTKPKTSLSSALESEVIQRIDQRLPEDLSLRLGELVAKRRAEELTDEEHAELIRLGDEVERIEAIRLEALSELALLHKTRLPDLMQAMGLTTPPYE